MLSDRDDTPARPPVSNQGQTFHTEISITYSAGWQGYASSVKVVTFQHAYQMF